MSKSVLGVAPFPASENRREDDPGGVPVAMQLPRQRCFLGGAQLLLPPVCPGTCKHLANTEGDETFKLLHQLCK